ncbi:MAG: lasso peptide biosynthesis B2 protein [Chloroflexi bacterium]|nr:lasso peptide biosynthesis B2 protein [Chloroflexota bacterium]
MSNLKRRFLHFGMSDWLNLARAYGYLVRATWKLYVRREGLSPWLRDERRAGDVSDPLHQQATEPQKDAVLFVDIASRHPYLWARCLQQSLAVCMWLRTNRQSPVLRIGVRRNGGAMEAHAWVEVGGTVLGQDGVTHESYVPLVKTAAASPYFQDRGGYLS